MAVQAPSLTFVRLPVAVVSAVCAFHVAVHAASPEPDKVSLSELTITWSTVKYATDAQNGFVSGSLDKTIIVDRTFRTHVLENCYLKVTLVPEFGGAFFPSSTSRPATNSSIAPKSACLTG